MKLLISDDDLDSGSSLAELLGLFGHACVVVTSGEAAIDEFQAQPYDAVLMDLKMPGIGGLAATRRILEHDPQAKIIVISGNVVREELSEVCRLPVVTVLRKPFSPNDLTNALAACAAHQDGPAAC